MTVSRFLYTCIIVISAIVYINFYVISEPKTELHLC